jgi:hypothetical protein
MAACNNFDERVLADLSNLALQDGCCCRNELDQIDDDEVRHQVLAGCNRLDDHSAELEDYLRDILQETVENYYIATGAATIMCSMTNQFTRNYDFLLRNLSLIAEVNECFNIMRKHVDGDWPYDRIASWLNNNLRETYAMLLRGIFPNHFARANHSTEDLQQRVADLRKNVETYFVTLRE